jgi:hypothetical protein
MTTRRGVFAFILGAVAAAKLKPSPAWASIMPPQPVAEVGLDDLLKQAWEEYQITPDYMLIEWPLKLTSRNWADDADAVLEHHFPRSHDGD